MKYRGIFFDFDYTLGDATEAIVAGFLYGLHTMGYPIPTREEIRHTVGFVLKDGFTNITGERDEAKRDEFCKLYRSICTPAQIATAVLCDGARELLETLHSRGVKLAVVSSKPGPILHKILERMEILSLFDVVIGPEQVHRPKPDPAGILWTLEATGLSAGEILYCGDTVIDAGAGQNAGVDFCAVLNGTTPAADFDPWPHVHIAPDLPELQRWLIEEGRV